MTQIIAITGGKGGTGKSTVATALSSSLSKQNKVLLVDADVDCPNDHLLLDIEKKKLKFVSQRIPKFDLEKCSKCGKCGKVCQTKSIVSLKNRNPIFLPEQCNGCGSCSIVCPEDAISWETKNIGTIFEGRKNKLDLLSGDLNANEPVSEFIVNSLNELIEEKTNDYDYIIIDTAAGTHCPVIAAFELADKIIAVTEPTPLGSHDLDIILRLLKKLGKNASIIVNRSDIGDLKMSQEISERHNSKIILKIPYSTEIVNSYSKGNAINIPKINSVISK